MSGNIALKDQAAIQEAKELASNEKKQAVNQATIYIYDIIHQCIIYLS